MGIVFGCISPHPPVIVPEVGQGRERETAATLDALGRLAQELAAQRLETAVLVSTHGPLREDAFGVLTTERAAGSFRQWGAPALRLEYPNDLELVAAIQEACRTEQISVAPIEHWELDWGCTVPLYHLREGLAGARLVPLTVCFLSPQAHFDFGRAVAQAAEGLGRRAAVIASADLSHRLLPEGPYGSHPAGPAFDRRFVEAVRAWDVAAVLGLSLDLREQAGEDAVASVAVLMGALEHLDVQPKVLSYEGPFGVGYMVAAIQVLGPKAAAEAGKP